MMTGRPDFLAKCSQFLTKSIMTAEPKVKCSVVLAGSYGASCACAWLLKSRLVCGGSSHRGTPRLLVRLRAGAAMAAGGALASAAPDAPAPWLGLGLGLELGSLGSD